MHKKRVLVLGTYLSLLALAACGPKVVDDSDLVSFDYKYTLDDGTVVEQGSAELIIGENSKYQRLESTFRGAKQDDEFNGKINGSELYGSEYSQNKVQSYPNIILTEVMGIENPSVGNQIEVNSIGNGVITSIEKDADGYDVYVVDFNDPKTYSELSYSVKITGLEKM